MGEGDEGFPVEIEGTQKTCRFDKAPGFSTITCDTRKFMSSSIEEQYVLIHHEYAGLAGLESPNGPDSNYEISNQISGYLQETVVTKLAVHPSKPSEVPYAETIRKFVRQNFPSEDLGEDGIRKIEDVQIDKTEYSDATGEIDIEVHAIFDSDAYVARRIFIGAEAVLDGEHNVVGCKNLLVKASYFHPLSE